MYLLDNRILCQTIMPAPLQPDKENSAKTIRLYTNKAISGPYLSIFPDKPDFILKRAEALTAML